VEVAHAGPWSKRPAISCIRVAIADELGSRRASVSSVRSTAGAPRSIDAPGRHGRAGRDEPGDHPWRRGLRSTDRGQNTSCAAARGPCITIDTWARSVVSVRQPSDSSTRDVTRTLASAAADQVKVELPTTPRSTLLDR
jgi:hypothetical protein